MDKVNHLVKISVRNLVEFVMMSGDIVTGFSGTSRNTEAIKAHQIVQRAAGDNYKKEVTVSYLLERQAITLEVNGRIDGVVQEQHQIIIDEIKTTTRPLEYIDEEYNQLHWAQAKCYAYIYGKQNNLDNVGVRLTYYQLDTKEIKYLNKHYTLVELEEFFYDVIDKYIYWASILKVWADTRDKSIKEIQFPFGSYRRGQRELAVATYRTITEGKKLFAQAPTGIGKTIATLFPSIKAIGEGYGTKIFYLTAKTITRSVAQGALDKMRQGGLRIKSLTITAKEKICFKEISNCNPEHCEYAKGHYDRVKDALYDIYDQDCFTREVVEEYSKKHRVCPFEFSLDLSYWCDCIICDYNYAFDPRVYLKRFFMEGSGDYIFLIDEAHNLVDRSREMFSAQLFKKPVLNLKRNVRQEAPQLAKILNKINSFMIGVRKDCEEGQGFMVHQDQPKEIYPLLASYITAAEKWLINNPKSPLGEEVVDFYFQAFGFLRTAEYYDEKYVTYYEKLEDDVAIKLFCLDPSRVMEEVTKRARASIFFSATLNPMDYYIYMEGGNEKSYRITLQSPFDKENLAVIINDRISTKYNMRQSTYQDVAQAIGSVIKGRVGNYLIFFPSYQYMREVQAIFEANNPQVKVITQKVGMTEEEREQFLQQFSSQSHQTLAAFAVMGGIFGEGIDLVGDKLVGAVIVGVGLPQICLERDIIKSYFDKLKGMGFEYAYIYPGMNKVMQAIGRVIRAEEDRGVAMLIDQRFSQYPYKALLPKEWTPITMPNNIDKTINIIDDFWKKL